MTIKLQTAHMGMRTLCNGTTSQEKVDSSINAAMNIKHWLNGMSRHVIVKCSILSGLLSSGGSWVGQYIGWATTCERILIT
jgi:hypothetical protein